MVHRWWQACILLVLGDIKNHNDISGQWNNKWPFISSVDSLIFQWLREPFQPMLLNEPGEYTEPNYDEVSTVVLPQKSERVENMLPITPSKYMVVILCFLSGHVSHLNQWLTNNSSVNVEIIHMYTKMGNDECLEMQFNFPDLQNPSLLISTPKVGATDLTLSTINYSVIIQILWILNEQGQAFACVIQ